MSKTPGKSILKESYDVSHKPLSTPACANIFNKQKTPKTPSGDRFIPNRSKSITNLHSLISNCSNSTKKQETKCLNGKIKLSKSKSDITTDMMSQIYLEDSSNTSIFSYSTCSNNTNDDLSRLMNPLNLNRSYIEGHSLNQSSLSKLRPIASKPEKMLDAPDIINDYYLNLLDWGARNILAIGLGSSVYLWNNSNGETTHLMDCNEIPNDNPSENIYVSSLSWMENGKFLAVGLSDSKIQLWDISTLKMARTLAHVAHKGRIAALAWRSHILSCGSQTGVITHNDVRIERHVTAHAKHHKLEVCGLKWSPNNKLLASGANDNTLCLWDASKMSGPPLFVQDKQHVSAVKALAWCPWKLNLLASGGGAVDRKICTWNTESGTLIKRFETESQVCSLVWGKLHKELVSSHGGPDQNIITVWKYPAMVPIAKLQGHSDRVLFTALNPDGTMLASAGADETINLWKFDSPSSSRNKDPNFVASLENKENVLYNMNIKANDYSFNSRMDVIR